MSYEVAMSTLKEMRSRFDSGFSSSDKVIIEHLYSEVCNKRVRNTGCKDCWRDAYIEVRRKLKILGTMPKKPNYVLKAGVVLHEPGTSQFYTLSNCPDEVAERYLGKYPHFINQFETYPLDYETRVKSRLEGKPVAPTYDELKAVAEKLSGEAEAKDGFIDTLTEQTNTLKADLEASQEEADSLRQEVAKVNEQLDKCKAEARKEVADLNKENADLKAEVERLTKELEKALKAKANKATAAKDAATETTQEEGK